MQEIPGQGQRTLRTVVEMGCMRLAHAEVWAMVRNRVMSLMKTDVSTA